MMGKKVVNGYLFSISVLLFGYASDTGIIVNLFCSILREPYVVSVVVSF